MNWKGYGRNQKGLKNLSQDKCYPNQDSNQYLLYLRIKQHYSSRELLLLKY
jgi:hypothetical protein